MDITFTSPALLFPAVSLILLAYTNRFHALATLLRQMLEQYRKTPTVAIYTQLDNLLVRIRLIRWMQALGILSVTLAVICMLVLFEGLMNWGRALFMLSLLSLIASLSVSLYETHLSIGALTVQVRDVLSDVELKQKSGLSGFDDD